MSDGFSPGILIPIVAIAGSFAIPIVAIFMDYKRRRLHSEERRAMIEKGMVPPVVDENANTWGQRPRDLASQRERSLRSGIIMLMLGVGLAVAFWVQLNYGSDDFARHVPRWGLAMAAAIVGFLGLGNLIYYAVTGKKEV
ncbi:MAG: DUF6249 domain-containing protein [Pseudomonadota bacterium]